MPSSLSNLAPNVNGKRRVLTCHRARLSGDFPANSLAAVQECVQAGAPRIEIDVRFLADDSLLVFHDESLEAETNGRGFAHHLDRACARALRLHDGITPLCFLEEVVDIVRDSDATLQVDLKAMRRMTDAQVYLLAEALAPLGKRALIGSEAWWNVRRFDANVFSLALDPTLLLHYRTPREDEDEQAGAERRLDRGYLPVQREIHGLLDDSALAQLGDAGSNYFAERLLDILGLVPGVSELMVDCGTIRRMAAFGFNLGRALDKRAIELAAWTVRDEGQATTLATLTELFALDVTTIITDAPMALSEYLTAAAAVTEG